MITKAETEKRKRKATVYDECPTKNCEYCGKERDLFQDHETYAWICNRCYWFMTREGE